MSAIRIAPGPEKMFSLISTGLCPSMGNRFAIFSQINVHPIVNEYVFLVGERQFSCEGMGGGGGGEKTCAPKSSALRFELFRFHILGLWKFIVPLPHT